MDIWTLTVTSDMQSSLFFSSLHTLPQHLSQGFVWDSLGFALILLFYHSVCVSLSRAWAHECNYISPSTHTVFDIFQGDKYLVLLVLERVGCVVTHRRTLILLLRSRKDSIDKNSLQKTLLLEFKNRWKQTGETYSDNVLLLRRRPLFAKALCWVSGELL